MNNVGNLTCLFTYEQMLHFKKALEDKLITYFILLPSITIGDIKLLLSPPFAVFLSNHLKFQSEMLPEYLVILCAHNSLIIIQKA